MADLEQEYSQLAEKARRANLRREKEVRSIYDEIIQRYQPGGQFLAGSKAELEQRKVKDVGGSMQQLISSGLFGTTEAAGLGRRWEAEVGEPGRARLEDISMERLSGAQREKAGFVERIQEPYPDYGALAAASQAQGATPGGGGGRQGWRSGGGARGVSSRVGPYAGQTSIVSGGSAAPTTYNPLTDPSRHAPVSTPTAKRAPSTGGYRDLQGGTIKSGYYYPKRGRGLGR